MSRRLSYAYLNYTDLYLQYGEVLSRTSEAYLSVKTARLS
jgi:hypothetical protein